MSSQIEHIWDNIGTAWDEFEDKALIEKFWNALASGNQYIYSHVGNTQFSRVIDLMDGSFDYGPETFYIVYSGTETEVNTEPATVGTTRFPNTLFEFAIPEFTYSIPTITYDYKYNGVAYTGTYTEGVDYVITSGMNELAWINAPTKDLRYSTMGVIVGTAKHLYRINPVLGNVWAAQCGFDIATNASGYNTFGQERYKHLKMLIWALDYYQNQAPSIYTLKNAFGVSSGCPFAYTSGLMSYSLIDSFYNVSLEGETYIFPSGIHPRPSGYYDQFEILSDGLELYDYTTYPTFIDAHANPFTRRSTLIYQVDPIVSGLPYAQDFRNEYIERIMPAQIQYLIL